jgi:anti-anti-sigma factor
MEGGGGTFHDEGDARDESEEYGFWVLPICVWLWPARQRVEALEERRAVTMAGRSGATQELGLNFSDLEHMDSGGMGLLVTLLVRAKGQRLVAFGLSDCYWQVFELTRLDEAVGLFDCEAEALAAANGG